MVHAQTLQALWERIWAQFSTTHFQIFVGLGALLARGSFLTGVLHSMMLLVRTLAGLKHLHAFDPIQWYSLGCSLSYRLTPVNSAQTLKAHDATDPFGANHELCHHTDDVTQH
jgi:hypothetical protein